MGMIISELRRGDNDLGSTDNRYTVFKIGDLLFEYDESKNKKISKNMGFLLKWQHVCFSIIIE